MTFISYAQNFEDLMLWRAFKHVECGFYIDVGAWSPDVDSVTRAFYERGWRGINVEPNPEFHDQLTEHRTRDINLRVAVSDKTDALVINIFSDTGLSTFDETIAHNHALAGWTADKQMVEVTTLADLWMQHVPEGQEVHFLKVDVEGFEGAVLRGNDWSKNRPWIVVVEATLPMSQQESHGEWEPTLLNANYHFIYADGLNRFYVADEHVELRSFFKHPPNVFDDFKLGTQHQAEARAMVAEARTMEAEARTMEAEAKTKEAETNVHQLQDMVNGLNRELQVVYASRSWRITRPLRAAFCALRRMSVQFPHISCDLKGCIRGLLSHALVHLMRFALAHPTLKEHALALLRRSPWIKARLRKFAGDKGLIAGGTPMQTYSANPCETSIEPSELTPSARRVYIDLKAAIERQNKRGS